MSRLGWVTLWCALCGFGCGGDDETTATGCDGANSVLYAWPEDGEATVYDRTVVEFTLAREDEAATITLVDSAGAPVPGATTRDGLRITFTPDAPLTPGASYTSTLTYCDVEERTFTVEAEAPAAVDPATLVDRTWILSLTDGRDVSPFGIGPALERYVAADLLLTVDAVDAQGVWMSAGASSIATGEQDLCSETSIYDSPATYVDPFFTVFEEDILLVVLGDRLDIQDLTLSGSFWSSGTEIRGVRLDGILDTRNLAEELGFDAADPPESVCNLFSAGYGVDCEECPADTKGGPGQYCMRLVLDGITMTEAPYDMLPRTADEIAVDPACQ